MLNTDASGKTGDSRSLKAAWLGAMLTAQPRSRAPLLANSRA